MGGKARGKALLAPLAELAALAALAPLVPLVPLAALARLEPLAKASQTAPFQASLAPGIGSTTCLDTVEGKNHRQSHFPINTAFTWRGRQDSGLHGFTGSQLPQIAILMWDVLKGIRMTLLASPH